MLLFYSLKTNYYSKGLYICFSFSLPKAFFFARLSPAKSEQPVNVYWVILQVGVIKGWKNEWATLEATEAVLVAKEQAFLAVNPTQLQLGLNIQGLQCLLLSKACLDGLGTGIEGLWAGLRILWLCLAQGGRFCRRGAGICSSSY